MCCPTSRNGQHKDDVYDGGGDGEEGVGGNSPVGSDRAKTGNWNGKTTCTRPFCCLLCFHVASIAAHDLSDFGLRIEYFIAEPASSSQLGQEDNSRTDGEKRKEKKKEEGEEEKK
ncbi:hypothetical protein Trydic_g17661 [Trypoxylus dichotomus]